MECGGRTTRSGPGVRIIQSTSKFPANSILKLNPPRFTMSTIGTRVKTSIAHGGAQLPDPLAHSPDKIISFNRPSVNCKAYLLAEHLVKPEATLVGGKHHIARDPNGNMIRLRYPDLFVAIGVDLAAYYRAYCYVISEQGKPPEFVLEIASRRTGGRTWCRSGRPMPRWAYWSTGGLTSSGQYQGTILAGDRRLVH